MKSHNVPIPVYVDENAAPDHALATKWETVCHSRGKLLFVYKMGHYKTSRWGGAQRMRPWSVVFAGGNTRSERGWFATLDAAVKRAQELARDPQ